MNELDIEVAIKRVVEPHADINIVNYTIVADRDGNLDRSQVGDRNGNVAAAVCSGDWSAERTSRERECDCSQVLDSVLQLKRRNDVVAAGNQRVSSEGKRACDCRATHRHDTIVLRTTRRSHPAGCLKRSDE